MINEGPLDVGMGNSCTLPRRSIPVNLTGSLKNKVKHLTLARWVGKHWLCTYLNILKQD
jgi:hypothetical protein